MLRFPLTTTQRLPMFSPSFRATTPGRVRCGDDDAAAADDDGEPTATTLSSYRPVQHVHRHTRSLLPPPPPPPPPHTHTAKRQRGTFSSSALADAKAAGDWSSN